MKVRPLLILLLVVISTGILVRIYYTSLRERTEERNPRWAAILSDLEACGHLKHLKATHYEHFANIAQREGQADAARLFRAMAFSERLHEYNCANAILQLGGHYAPPANIAVFGNTTDNNLQRSIDYERQSLAARHPDDIERALNKENRYAARVLIWARAGDVQHILLMGRCHHAAYQQHATTPVSRTQPVTALADTPPSGYLVCPGCGNIYAEDSHDAYCPHCLTDGRRFIRFED